MYSSCKCAGRLLHTRGPDSKVPVAKCVVCAWNGAQSVGGRVESTSETFQGPMNVVGGAWPDKEEKTKHVSLKSVLCGLETGPFGSPNGSASD